VTDLAVDFTTGLETVRFRGAGLRFAVGMDIPSRELSDYKKPIVQISKKEENMTENITEEVLEENPIETELEVSPRENMGVVYPSPAVLVREFHETYGQAIRDVPTLDIPERKMRVRLVEEEYTEYRDAEEADDLVEIADALGDIVYVAYGAALAHGIDLDAVLQEIQRSNMSKLGVDGKPIYVTEGEKKGKVVKGPNFSEPDLATELKAQGWLGA